MKVAVLSDIHSNHIALRRCLDDAFARGAQRFLFLGDYTADLAYPQKTMEILYALRESYDCTFIRGNKEGYWLNYRDSGEEGWNDNTVASMLYNYRNLTPRDMAFFESLPIVKKLEFPGLPSMTICHGSPCRINENMRPNDPRTFEIMEHSDTPLILFGHTHLQGRIARGKVCAYNPGACGMPYRSEGKAQYMLLHGKNWTWREEFISLAYDVAAVIQEMHASGLYEKAPYWSFITEQLLRTGKITQGCALKKVMDLCKKDTGVCIWPDIPEKYWQQGLKEMYPEYADHMPQV